MGKMSVNQQILRKKMSEMKGLLNKAEIEIKYLPDYE